MQFFYTVRPGDTLSQIARRWQMPLDSLIAANNLADPDVIYSGQQLSIPPGVDMVRVQPGDTVFRIAERFGVPSAVIIEANQLRPPFHIQVGQFLRVPPGVPYYVVQPGDTLFEIAKRFNVTTRGHSNPERIRVVNQLPSYTIYPRMKLVIPYAPPGDEGMIAYTTNRGASYDIWLYDPIYGENRQLTDGLGETYSIPFWSPDGKSIAFVGRRGILYVVQVEEGRVAQIDQFAEGLGVFLDWSPDSKRLAYVNRNEIVLYDVTTHRARVFSQPGARDVNWFPSGRDVLFQAPDNAGVSQLYVMPTDTGKSRQITQNTGGAYNNVRLSPDGSYVLYTTPGVSISIIFTIDLFSEQEFEIGGGPLAKNYFPAWSPDSMTIAYSATAFEFVGYFSQIRTTGRRGENDRTRAISDCFATPVTWSPDSRKVAYLSRCEEGIATEMWLLDTMHPVPIQLIEGVSITALSWSPRSTRSRDTYRHPLYRVAFEYPAHWQRVDGERYEGDNGFFQISAISSEGTLEEVCRNEAFHPLQPYGSKPRIVPTTIQNQKACMIFPSADQPPDMRNQSALIVRYPTPITIDDTTYEYFILWAEDQAHLSQISATLVFL